MASSKRRSSKQKRTRQNRQVREARRARSARAGEATAIAGAEQEATSARPVSGRRAAGGGAAESTAGRTRRRSPFTIPGQRAVVMAFLFTIVAAATLLLAPVQVEREVPPDDPRVEAEDPDVNDDGMVSIYEDAKLLDEEGPAVAAGIMLTPIAITGAAVWFTKRPQRSNAWTIAMIALSAYIFLFAGPYGIIALPSLIALAVGGFQSRRAENKQRLAQMRADRAAAGAGDDHHTRGEVIDVDAVEDAGTEEASAQDDGAEERD